MIEKSSDNREWIFGKQFMQNNYLIFDQDNLKIGRVEYSQDYLDLEMGINKRSYDYSDKNFTIILVCVLSFALIVTALCAIVIYIIIERFFRITSRKYIYSASIELPKVKPVYEKIFKSASISPYDPIDRLD